MEDLAPDQWQKSFDLFFQHDDIIVQAKSHDTNYYFFDRDIGKKNYF